MLKVLVVEDDPSVAALVRQLLESEGFVATHTTNLEGAWQVLSRDVPDAALVDLGLAGGESGWDLIEQIRSSEALGDLPLVVLTATPAADVVERARSLQCVYLGKPFSAAALLDRLQIAIRRVGRGPGTRPWVVAMIVGGYRVEGTVHVSSDLVRFSDAWEALVRDNRVYVPVTGARVISLADGRTVGTSDLMEIRKEQLTMAAPVEGMTWGAAEVSAPA